MLADCRSATRHKWPRAPRSAADSTENGSRTSDGAPVASSAVSCSAPSRSAGCTEVPCSRLRRRSWPTAAPEAGDAHMPASVRYAGPYSRPIPRNAEYRSAALTAAPQLPRTAAGCGRRRSSSGGAAPVEPPQWAVLAPSSVSSLRTSKRSSAALSSHTTRNCATSPSSKRGCRKKTRRSKLLAASVAASVAASLAARAISR